jgi:hypothetical protein
MKMVFKSLLRLLGVVVFLVVLPLGKAGATGLDGTMWMYEHESGVRHYVAFYDSYHYLNSSGSDSYAGSLWLRSISPYFSHVNHDGSITYSATHVSPAAWAINWGRCDIDADYGSFNAAGMFYSIFIYNHNEPYKLISTKWHPHALVAGSSFSLSADYIPTIFFTIFGQ